MSASLKHSRLSTAVDSQSASKIHPSDWNAAHVFSGGTNGQLLVADSTVSAGASWSGTLSTIAATTSVFGAGTGGSTLAGSPLRVVVTESVFGASSASRFENTSLVSGSGFGLDLVAGSVLLSDYVHGRFVTARGATLSDSTVSIGSQSVHDFILTTGGGTILRFNRNSIPSAGPYFIAFGAMDGTFPAWKRDTIFLQLRKSDDSGVSGAATGSLPAAAAARDGIIGFDTTLNALVYYVGGNRYKLAGTSF